MKTLIPVAWTLWGASILALLYALYSLSNSRANSPELLRDFGVFILYALILADVLTGAALCWATYRQSFFGVAVITAILGGPCVFLLFIGVIGSALTDVKHRQFAAELAKEGSFRDPKLQPLAAAITAADPVALKTALANQPAPNGKDRAGYDLLNFALRRYRFSSGSFECIKLLLEAGADPNSPEPTASWPPLASLGDDPASVRLFVENGANIEAPADGLTPVVRFTMLRQWESAIYLVRKGARLDTRNEHGLSLDYFIEDWKDGVNGEQPEGWSQLRAAIRDARRASPSVTVATIARGPLAK